jgi:CHAD domain-containing protein
MREIERKYAVPDDFAVPADFGPEGTTVGEPRRHRLAAVYYDTPDLRLARDRVTLRRRTGGSDDGWHVKRWRGPDEREERQLPPGRPGVVPAVAAAEVRALSRGARLRPVVTLATQRTEWPLLDGDGRVLAVIADDAVSASTMGDPATAQQWREVEVELVDGDRDLLGAVDQLLRRAGAGPAPASSKLARALDGRWPGPAPTPAPAGSAAAVVGDYLRAQRDVLVDYDPRVRRDEPDSVHKMRVATRRLRSTLKTFRPLFDRDEADRLRAELRWLAEALGRVRDAEVLRKRLSTALADVPDELVLGPVAARLTDGLRGEQARHRRALIRVLDGKRYVALLDDLDELLSAPPTDRGARPAGKELRGRVRKAVGTVEALLDAAERVGSGGGTDLPLPGTVDRNTALHEARKAAKRARYAAEAVAPAAGAPATRLAAAMEEVQELLGGHHDSVVTRDLLLRSGLAAHAAGENAFTYGLLYEREVEAATHAEADLPAAGKKAGRRKTRAWLD